LNNYQAISFQNDFIPVQDIDIIPKSIKGYTTTYNHINYSILLFGGYPATDNHTYELDMKEKKWKMLNTSGTSPEARHNHTGVLHHEFYFVFGGANVHEKKLNDLKMLDLQNYKWIEVESSGNPPTPRSNHTAVWYKNSMIVYGGEGASPKNIFSDCYIFNFSTLKWTTIELQNPIGKTFPKRSSHSVCIYGDQMMIFGGKDSSGLQNDTFLLNLQNKTISKLKTKNDPVKRKRANLLARSGFILMFGGFVGSQEKPQNQLYMMRLDNLKWMKVGLGEEVLKNYSYHLLFSQGNLVIH
jgi:N-acetylneuraminic acid mutarotase